MLLCDVPATQVAVVVVESDKADMDVETFHDGFLAAVLVPAGESAPVGSAIALLAESEEEIPLARSQAANFSSSAAAPIGLALSSSRLPALPAPRHRILLLRCTAAVLLLPLHWNQPENAWKWRKSPSVSLLDLDRLP